MGTIFSCCGFSSENDSELIASDVSKNAHTKWEGSIGVKTERGITLEKIESYYNK